MLVTSLSRATLLSNFRCQNSIRLFGVYANLFREPIVDQTLEIAVARDLGVQLFALETPWSAIEPKPGASEFRVLDRLMSLAEKRFKTA